MIYGIVLNNLLKVKFIYFSHILNILILAIDQQPSGDLIKLFYDWLNLAYELHKYSTIE